MKGNEMDWMKTAVDSLKEKLEFAYELRGSREAAIEMVKGQTCAGSKAWEIALNQLGWAAA